jgi:hypothetical protein
MKMISFDYSEIVIIYSKKSYNNKKCKIIRIHNYWVSLTKLKDWAFKPRLFLLADKYGSTICISAKFQQGSCHM